MFLRKQNLPTGSMLLPRAEYFLISSCKYLGLVEIGVQDQGSDI